MRRKWRRAQHEEGKKRVGACSGLVGKKHERQALGKGRTGRPKLRKSTEKNVGEETGSFGGAAQKKGSWKKEVSLKGRDER